MSRFIIRSIVLAANLIFIVCMLLCFWAAKLSPDKVFLPSLFTILLPVYIVLNLLFLVFWLIFHRSYSLFSLVALLISYSSVIQVFPIHFNAAKKDFNKENSFSIMTYNTHEFSNYKKHLPGSENKVVQYVLDVDVDIVCIQELVVVGDKNYMTEEDVLRIFKKYPYKQFYFNTDNKFWRGGLAIFSKYPIIDSQTIPIASSYSNGAIYSDISVGDDTIRVISCHLESNKLTGEDKAPSLNKMKSINNVSNFTDKITNKLNVASKTRALQAGLVAQVREKSPYKTIICGDFNDTPFSYTYTKSKGDFLDAFAELSWGYGATFNESVFRFRIDYFFYDKNLKPFRFYVDKVKHSDHYPLFCVFEKNISDPKN